MQRAITVIFLLMYSTIFASSGMAPIYQQIISNINVQELSVSQTWGLLYCVGHKSKELYNQKNIDKCCRELGLYSLDVLYHHVLTALAITKNLDVAVQECLK